MFESWGFAMTVQELEVRGCCRDGPEFDGGGVVRDAPGVRSRRVRSMTAPGIQSPGVSPATASGFDGGGGRP